jgi:hypothetical protein
MRNVDVTKFAPLKESASTHWPQILTQRRDPDVPQTIRHPNRPASARLFIPLCGHRFDVAST